MLFGLMKHVVKHRLIGLLLIDGGAVDSCLRQGLRGRGLPAATC